METYADSLHRQVLYDAKKKKKRKEKKLDAELASNLYADFVFLVPRGRTYVMITYVSKENNLGPDDKNKVYLGS